MCNLYKIIINTTLILYSSLTLADVALNNDISPDLSVPAVISSYQNPTISSQINAEIITLNIQDGDFFKKGDILIGFQCLPLQEELKKSDAIVERTLARFESNQRLATLNSVSLVELQESKSNYNEAKADQAIKQHLVNKCNIKAPFDGQVTDLFVNQYETIRNGDPLLKILDNDDLYINIMIPSAWLNWLGTDSTFKLFIRETNKTYNATISKVIYNVDAVSRTVKIIGKLNNGTAKLFAGMNGDAIFNKDKIAKDNLKQKNDTESAINNEIIHSTLSNLLNETYTFQLIMQKPTLPYPTIINIPTYISNNNQIIFNQKDKVSHE